MKTAEMTLAKYSKQVKETLEWSKSEDYPFYPDKLLINAGEALKAMKEYALASIKEDRKNLLQYIETVPVWGNLIEESVINAPIIDLK